MMFHKLDMEIWPRREHYSYYQEKIRTCYQVNVDLDVTKLVKRCKEKGNSILPGDDLCHHAGGQCQTGISHGVRSGRSSWLL